MCVGGWTGWGPLGWLDAEVIQCGRRRGEAAAPERSQTVISPDVPSTWRCPRPKVLPSTDINSSFFLFFFSLLLFLLPNQNVPQSAASVLWCATVHCCMYTVYIGQKDNDFSYFYTFITTSCLLLCCCFVPTKQLVLYFS